MKLNIKIIDSLIIFKYLLKSAKTKYIINLRKSCGQRIELT